MKLPLFSVSSLSYLCPIMHSVLVGLPYVSTSVPAIIGITHVQTHVL